ncbi:MAG: lysozyme [Leptospiraceae bacterium]|nr:lysozyme [Leptospiraceae bacterium]
MDLFADKSALGQPGQRYRSDAELKRIAARWNSNPLASKGSRFKAAGWITAVLAALMIAAGFCIELIASRFLPPAFHPVRGLDVSHHRGKIDWNLVQKTGFRFAYIKATEGNHLRDPNFMNNWQAARRNQLIPGAYHYYSFCAEPHRQALNFARAIPRTKLLMMPPAIDIEFSGNCPVHPTPLQLKSDLLEFSAVMYQHFKYHVILYLTRKAFQAYGDSLSDSYSIWISDVRSRPDDVNWLLWQHSVWGSVPGIRGDVDLNVFNGSRLEFYGWLMQLHFHNLVAHPP